MTLEGIGLVSAEDEDLTVAENLCTLSPCTSLMPCEVCRSGTLAMYAGVFTLRPTAVVVAGAILLADLPRYMMHLVFKNNFSPERSHNGMEERSFYGRNDTPRYSYRSKPKVTEGKI